MAALTQVSSNLLLDLINGRTSTAPVTAPLKLALTTSVGSTTAAGVEVSGGSYARQAISFAAASGGNATTSATVAFSALPAATITGVEVWDSAATPKRIWYGPLQQSKTVAAGDTFQVAAGTFTVAVA